MSVVNNIKEHWFKVKKVNETSHSMENDAEKQYYKGLRDQMPIGTEYYLCVKEKRPTRSLSQNNYYWLYLGKVSDDTGYTSDELHEYYKQKFLTGQTVQIKDITIERYPTTTQLTVKEFMDYVRNIEVDCGIPAPDIRLCGLYEHLCKAGMI